MKIISAHKFNARHFSRQRDSFHVSNENDGSSTRIIGWILNPRFQLAPTPKSFNRPPGLCNRSGFLEFRPHRVREFVPLVMRLCQTLVKQRQNRNRLRRRALKIKEPHTRHHSSLRQFCPSLRIDLLLKQTENLRLHRRPVQLEINRQFPPPNAFDPLMLRIIVVCRQMVRIERLSSAIDRFDF